MSRRQMQIKNKTTSSFEIFEVTSKRVYILLGF